MELLFHDHYSSYDDKLNNHYNHIYQYYENKNHINFEIKK